MSPGGVPRRVFCCAAAPAAPHGGFHMLGEIQGDQSHAISKGPKRKSGRTAARGAQPCNSPGPDLLSERAESIAGKVIELAEQGDRAAIRLCMERLVLVIKHQPIAVELPTIEKPADSVEAAATIAAAVAAGELTSTAHAAPKKWLTKVTKTGIRQPRIHALWVDARDTPADIDAKRDRLIAAGRARPDDT